MEQPEPASGWPDRPLSETEATALLDPTTAEETDLDPTELLASDGEPVAVWVMDHDDTVRSGAVRDDHPDDAVIDVVVETTVGFRMFSYTGGRWMDYGTQRHDDEEAPSMAGTLDSYRVLAGESETA